MEGVSLKSRAIAFAICVGAGAFILSVLAGAGTASHADNAANALIVAIICAVMSWASADQALSAVADAVDSAIKRLAAAAHGDFETPTPEEVRACLPELADSMDALFLETRSTFDSIHNLAMFDPVTSLANRTNFRRDVERALGELPSESTSALLFVDLDNFKAVNDTLGHAQGDHLLAKVANRLRAVLAAERHAGREGRFPGMIGRLAGDEFTMFLPDIAGPDDARRVAQRILYALNEDIELSGHTIRVGASIGVAIYPEHGRSLTTLMKAADVAMYHAKANGRAQAQLYTDALADALSERLRMEQDLRQALTHAHFRLAFQPQIALTSNEITTAEALLRWEHPEDGTRMPGEFIDIAEESALIVEIGDWVIDAVAATIARWDRFGIQQRLAINISPRQIEQHDFFSRLRERMEHHGAPARLLELEITEGLAMTCGDAVFHEMAAFRKDGAMISIDDFGTGYSNFSRLRDMPIDRVKLDRSMIADIAVSDQARAIIHAVIELIHGLGHKVVAEGVETREQVDVLKVIGCDAVQGYVIAPPMDEHEFLDWARVERPALAG
ncbi:bifunctional diguanylate cyclase/phosphodiesterase [Sphingomonas sp. LaA6.9]|uniref:putative bifunctional diguanylate cyclase/phosphodiesterase n=1 Tax=Sphingomonas sp. LaA6.9 TaxID=2919914 RepID=UPI001F4FB5F7|nr:EAL domain-containing protein [Sphingomonas sp. LaA6.9]MCJ8157458.1 EAL domain-containing protein [Sphingomonas sp. LaA6.9]